MIKRLSCPIKIFAALVAGFLIQHDALARDEDDLRRAVDWAAQCALQSKSQPVKKRAEQEEQLLKEANLLEKSKSVDAAEKYLTAQNVKLHSASLAIAVARYFEREEKDDDCTRALTDALNFAEKAGNDDSHRCLALEMRATHYAELGQLREAITDLNNALALIKKIKSDLSKLSANEISFFNSREYEDLTLRARVYLLTNDTKNCIADCNRIIKDYSWSKEGYKIKAKALQVAGRNEEAAACATEAIAHGVSARTMADVQLRSGPTDYATQYKTLTASMQSGSDDTRPRQRRAELSYGSKHYAEALADYNVLLRTSPTDEVFLLGRARTYLGLRKPLQAVDDFSLIIKTDPQSAATAYRGRAEAYKQLNDLAAQRDLARAGN
jgi:hypothetical protein